MDEENIVIQQLDLDSFEKAIKQLEESLRYYHSKLVQQDPGLIIQLRAAAIHAFAITYELSWKMLKRYLELTEPNPQEIDSISFTDLIRTGNEKGLLMSDLREWKVYRNERSITSHTYDQEKAAMVFAQVPQFLKEARYLFQQLKKRS